MESEKLTRIRSVSFVFAILVSFIAISGCGKPMDERVVYKIDSPDKSFRLVVTQTWQGAPYGAKGNIYITDWDESDRRLVDKYFTDFTEDLKDEQLIIWDEQAKGFKYHEKIVNLKTFSLD